ncbi:hypothetical protein FB451DRAFT_95344 [Mycena latifolia]|nr:hypothetical protein FB451DRAFT_95344 [Mycena latifolia]
MANPAWHYVLKFIITGDAAVGKSSLLVRLTDQRFLANPDPTFVLLAPVLLFSSLLPALTLHLLTRLQNRSSPPRRRPRTGQASQTRS